MEKQTGLSQHPVVLDRMANSDLNDLRSAVFLLEKPGAGIRLVNLLGYPIEGMINALPRGIGRAIGYMASKGGRDSLPYCAFHDE